MISIHKNSPPVGLVDLRNKVIRRNLTPKEEYDELNRKYSLKNTVRESLVKEQGHLCAYCMRRIPDRRVINCVGIAPVSLEHYIARNSINHSNPRGTGLGVDYNNLLAVCSGGRTPRGQYPDNELTCDASRGNKNLTVNPLDASTLVSIFYKNNGEIAAKDRAIEDDLVKTLNLNCIKYSALPDGRKDALAPIEAHIASLTSESDILDECRKLLKVFESETDPKTQYCGIIIWWLKDFINALS